MSLASEVSAFERFSAPRDCAFPASTLPRSKAPSSIASRSVRTSPVTRPEFHNCTRSVPSIFPSSCPRTTTSRADTSAFTLPFGPMVTLALPKSNLPSKAPSINRSSLPVISPLIRIPCVMHAVARGETGSVAEATVALTGTLAGALTVVGCELTVLGVGAWGAACGFASSFLHMRHLDQNSWIFEVVGLEGGATQKLQDSTGFRVSKAECQRPALACPVKQYPLSLSPILAKSMGTGLRAQVLSPVRDQPC